MSIIRLGLFPGLIFFICKVWCDVLFWCYDKIGTDVICDIYNNFISTRFSIYKLEAIYRYSGVLYDRLTHLLSYIYRNVNYYTTLGDGDFLFYLISRFETTYMYPKVYREVSTGHATDYYLEESIARSLHFINN